MQEISIGLNSISRHDPARIRRTLSGSANANCPGSSGLAIGNWGRKGLAACSAAIMKEFCPAWRQTIIVRRASSRAARRRLANAADGSSKNITPKREMTASKVPGAKSCICASDAMKWAVLMFVLRFNSASSRCDQRNRNVDPRTLAVWSKRQCSRDRRGTSATTYIQHIASLAGLNGRCQQIRKWGKQAIQHRLLRDPGVASTSVPQHLLCLIWW